PGLFVFTPPMEIYVKRERKTALPYSTRPKRSLLNQPFRLRRFRVMLSFASMSKSVTKDADRQPLRVVLLYRRGRLLVLSGSVLLFAPEPPVEWSHWRLKR